MHLNGFISESDLENANTLKQVVLAALLKDGLINEEGYETAMNSYIVNISKKTSLFRWVKHKLTKEELKDEGYNYFVSKLIKPLDKDGKLT